METDVINQLADIAADSPLGTLRASRDIAFNAAQGSFEALLEPADLGGVSHFEREAIAFREAYLEQSAPVLAFYRRRLIDAGATEAQLDAIETFPEGSVLPDRLVTILNHVDLLTLEPRAATPEALQKLTDAGLSTCDIVSISQLIAFVSFQIRLLATLRILKEDAA